MLRVVGQCKAQHLCSCRSHLRVSSQDYLRKLQQGSLCIVRMYNTFRSSSQLFLATAGSSHCLHVRFTPPISA